MKRGRRLSKTKLRERRDTASGEVRPETDLVRLAISPEGRLVPDLAAKLPGRGVWVAADRAAIAKALKKKAFARSAGQAVDPGPDLAAEIETALARSVLSLISLARRAGDLTSGFDQVRAEIKARRPALMIEASDGADDGRGKLVALHRAAWGEPEMVSLFTAAELGRTIGRDSAVHLCLAEGGLAERMKADVARLRGFRADAADLAGAAENG